VWYQPACGCRCGSACPACPACPVISTTTEKQHSTVEQQQQQQQQLGRQKQEVVSTTQSGTIFSGWFKEYFYLCIRYCDKT